MTRIIEAEYEELFGVAALYERNGTVRVRRGSLAQMPKYVEDPQLWHHRIEERFEHWKIGSTQHSQIDHSLTFYLEPIPTTPAPQPVLGTLESPLLLSAIKANDAGERLTENERHELQLRAGMTDREWTELQRFRTPADPENLSSGVLQNRQRSRKSTLERLKANVEARRRQEVKDHEAAVEAAKNVERGAPYDAFLAGAQWQRLGKKGKWDGNPVISEAIRYYLERTPMNSPKGWDHVLRVLKRAGWEKSGGTEQDFREAIAVVTEWAEQDKPKTPLQKLAEVEALAAALKAEGLASVVVGKLEAILNEGQQP